MANRSLAGNAPVAGPPWFLSRSLEAVLCPLRIPVHALTGDLSSTHPNALQLAVTLKTAVFCVVRG